LFFKIVDCVKEILHPGKERNNQAHSGISSFVIQVVFGLMQ
jgi:hypothetical protein